MFNFPAKIISVSPEQSGVSKMGTPWKMCETVLALGPNKDTVVAKCFNEQCVFCQNYDHANQPEFMATLEFEVESSIKYGDRKFQRITLVSNQPIQ